MTSASDTRHLHAIDVARVATVVAVIGVHATSQLLPANDQGAGAILSVLHSSREVFLILSAFVLTYSARGRTPQARPFWRRRVPLVFVPYAVWSAIYLLADGHLAGAGTVVGRYARDLLTGGARYHLYFLLLTLQLYLVFPWILAWLGRHRQSHRRILLASVAFQVLFTTAILYRLRLPAPLSTWLAHPGSWLPSYQLYVVIGILAGLHWDQVLAWVRAHTRLIAGGAAAAVGFGAGAYLLDLHLAGMTVLQASQVFQPAVVVESVAFGAAELAIGLWVVERARPRVLAGWARGGDVSFGVYLAHPLLLQAVVAAGVGAALARLAGGIGVVVVLAGVAPLLFVITAAGVALLRRTPLSLALTGRARHPHAGSRSAERKIHVEESAVPARPRDEASHPRSDDGDRSRLAVGLSGSRSGQHLGSDRYGQVRVGDRAGN